MYFIYAYLDMMDVKRVSEAKVVPLGISLDTIYILMIVLRHYYSPDENSKYDFSEPRLENLSNYYSEQEN